VLVFGVWILYFGHTNARKMWLKSDITISSDNNIVYGFDDKNIILVLYILLFLLYKYTDFKKSFLLIVLLYLTFYKNIIHNESTISSWLYIPSMISIPMYIISDYFYI
jgi:hypothetical protein